VESQENISNLLRHGLESAGKTQKTDTGPGTSAIIPTRKDECLLVIGLHE